MPPKRMLLLTCAAAVLTLALRSPSETRLDPPRTRSRRVHSGTLSVASASRTSRRGSRAVHADDRRRLQGGPDDVSALRYFAAQKNAGRVAAEIRLLRKKHPDFQPPDDLYATEQGSGDEQVLWDLYAKHDLSALRARIAELRQADPAWHASSDLAGKLALADGHDALTKASDEKRWPEVIGIAQANKGLLTCNDLDALWRTAEALAQSGQQSRALAAYRYVLVNCEGIATKVATVQKASLALGPGELDQILAIPQKQMGGHDDLDAARLELLRQKISAAGEGTSGTEPPQSEIDALAANARTATDAIDAQVSAGFTITGRSTRMRSDGSGWREVRKGS